MGRHPGSTIKVNLSRNSAQFVLLFFFLLLIFANPLTAQDWAKEKPRLPEKKAKKLFKIYLDEAWEFGYSKYTVEAIKTVFPRLLTEGIYLKIKANLPLDRKMDRTGYFRTVDFWISPRKDPWLKHEIARQWVREAEANKFGKLASLQFNNHILFFRRKIADNYRYYELAWITEKNKKQIAINLDLSFDKDEFPAKKSVHKKVKKILTNLLEKHPSSLTKNKLKNVVKGGDREYGIQKGLAVVDGEYEVNKETEELKRMKRAVKARMIRQVFLAPKFVYEKYETKEIENYNEYIKTNRKEIEKRISWPMSKRIIQTIDWMYKKIAKSEKMNEKVFSIFLHVLEGNILTFANIDWKLNKDKFQKSKKYLSEIWKLKPELSLAGLAVAANDFYLKQVDKGEAKKKYLINHFARHIKKEYYDGLPGIEKMRKKFKKAHLYNTEKENKKLYQTLKDWWEKKGRAGLMNWSVPEKINKTSYRYKAYKYKNNRIKQIDEPLNKNK